MQMVSDVTPPTADIKAIPMIQTFFLNSMICSTMTLIVTVFNLQVHSRDVELEPKMPYTA